MDKLVGRVIKRHKIYIVEVKEDDVRFCAGIKPTDHITKALGNFDQIDIDFACADDR
jgi:hypothetical protein